MRLQSAGRAGGNIGEGAKIISDARQPATSAASAYAEIKKKILNNEYGASATVPVQELSELLGMSRTPIRDALIRLEKEGLVELAPPIAGLTSVV